LTSAHNIARLGLLLLKTRTIKNLRRPSEGQHDRRECFYKALVDNYIRLW